MSRLLGDKAGIEVCEALGIDSDNITDLTLCFHAGEVARVEVTRYIDSTERDVLLKILERYEITGIKDAR